MNSIAIYTLTSELHDEGAVAAVTHEFLTSLHIKYDMRGSDYSDYGSHALDLIYVRTGGTEGIFLRLLPQLQLKSQKPFYLLTSGKSNSLAAAMEILSYLNQQGFKGEIIHGNNDYIHDRIAILSKANEARQQLQGIRLGIIGQPSDWLISSHADKDKVSQRLGITLVDIPMQELLDAIAAAPVKNHHGEGQQQKREQIVFEERPHDIVGHHAQDMTVVRHLGCFGHGSLALAYRLGGQVARCNSHHYCPRKSVNNLESDIL